MAKSMLRFYLDHSVNKILGFNTHNLIEYIFFGPPYFSFFYIPMNLHWLNSFKRNKSAKHFEKNATKGPHVNRKTLIFTSDNLWALIINCPYKSKPSLKCCIILWLLLLLFINILIIWLICFSCVSKVNYFNIIVFIHHYVLRLQISMHYSILLEIFFKID